MSGEIPPYSSYHIVTLADLTIITNMFHLQIKICGCFCLTSAVLCVVVTVTTTVIHMNRSVVVKGSAQIYKLAEIIVQFWYSKMINYPKTKVVKKAKLFLF